jgi:2'-5' RNA ligase
MSSRPESKQRLFFALWPDRAVRAVLASVAADAVSGNGRPTHVEDLHATLVFLGPVAVQGVRCVERAAGRVRGARFEVCLDRIEYWRRPRVLCVGASMCPPELDALVGELQRELRACGFQPERRPYRPHVTLARKARPSGAGAPASLIRWPISEFVLVSSESGPTPPRYRVLRRWPLHV